MAFIIRRFSSGSSVLTILGFFICLLGISAYVLYGKMGTREDIAIKFFMFTFARSDFDSRHLILQPLGVSLIIVGFFWLFHARSERRQNCLLKLILSTCVLINVGFGYEYVVDYAKQQVVVEKLESIGEVSGVDEYIFADQTILLNARGRLYRPKDWWGLVWTAYGLNAAERAKILPSCEGRENGRFVEINGPDTHWQALKNWVGDADMGFEVTVDDSPGACKPELMQIRRFAGVVPILFYFTGAKN
jgi:hypothetical protein